MPELAKNIPEQNKSKVLPIVPMKKKHIEAVKNLETRCNLSPWSIEDYENEILRDDSLATVAEIGGEVVGFIVARLITNSDGKNSAGLFKEIEIYNIAVDPTVQNSGIGQSLLDRLLSETVTGEAAKIWLEVRESNDVAIRFYKKNGFAEAYIRKNFYSTPTENAVVMMLEIPNSRRA